jgi:hypothetical protein
MAGQGRATVTDYPWHRGASTSNPKCRPILLLIAWLPQNACIRSLQELHQHAAVNISLNSAGLRDMQARHSLTRRILAHRVAQNAAHEM